MRINQGFDGVLYIHEVDDTFYYTIIFDPMLGVHIEGPTENLFASYEEYPYTYTAHPTPKHWEFETLRA